jgi:hypothetical protein
VVSNFPEFYKWEGDWITWLLSDFDIEHELDPEFSRLVSPAVLVISGDISGQGQQITEYVRRHGASGPRPIVIHMSDEWFGHPKDFYADAAVVFRNHFHPNLVDGKHVRYLPLGYSSNMPRPAKLKPVTERAHLWSFSGELKQRRNQMLDAARAVGPGFEWLTTQWDDKAALGRQDYADVLAESTFVMCPAGNITPDTFRFYEALEFGAIPVVEDSGGLRALTRILTPSRLIRVKPWKERRWRQCIRKAMTPSYWNQLYSNELPFPLVCNWWELEDALDELNTEHTAGAVQVWWQALKLRTRSELATAVQSVYGLQPNRSLK